MHLDIGDFMLRGEKLVNEAAKSELWVDEATGELVVKNNENKVTVWEKSIDLVCVHRFHVIFYDFCNDRVTQVHSIYDTDKPIRFTGDWEKLTWKINAL